MDGVEEREGDIFLAVSSSLPSQAKELEKALIEPDITLTLVKGSESPAENRSQLESPEI